MDIRKKLQGPAGYAVIGILLLASVVIAITGGDGGPVSKKTVGYYFYDLDTKELFVSSEQYGLIKAPSGGEGARAFVYACGDCNGERTITYLEKYAPDVLVAMKDLSLDGDVRDKKRLDGRKVRAVDGNEWIHAITPKGKSIQDDSYPVCPKGVRLKACEPTPAEL